MKTSSSNSRRNNQMKLSFSDLRHRNQAVKNPRIRALQLLSREDTIHCLLNIVKKGCKLQVLTVRAKKMGTQPKLTRLGWMLSIANPNCSTSKGLKHWPPLYWIWMKMPRLKMITMLSHKLSKTKINLMITWRRYQRVWEKIQMIHSRSFRMIGVLSLSKISKKEQDHKWQYSNQNASI